MSIVISILIGFVALLHGYFMWFEMFAWTTVGKKHSKTFLQIILKTKSLAANQGLYNGFLAAGLIWSLLISDGMWSTNIALFFLDVSLLQACMEPILFQKEYFIYKQYQLSLQSF